MKWVVQKPGFSCRDCPGTGQASVEENGKGRVSAQGPGRLRYQAVGISLLHQVPMRKNRSRGEGGMALEAAVGLKSWKGVTRDVRGSSWQGLKGRAVCGSRTREPFIPVI